MITTIQTASEPSPALVDEIAARLRAGGVALLPTDTIYGLHAVASNEAAVAKIASIKGRKAGKRFVVIAASVEQLLDYGAAVPDVLRSIWPAPLTAIVPHSVGNVAVRIPDGGWLRGLLERTGPLVSTSASGLYRELTPNCP